MSEETIVEEFFYKAVRKPTSPRGRQGKVGREQQCIPLHHRGVLNPD